MFVSATVRAHCVPRTYPQLAPCEPTAVTAATHCLHRTSPWRPVALGKIVLSEAASVHGAGARYAGVTPLRVLEPALLELQCRCVLGDGSDLGVVESRRGRRLDLDRDA